MVGEIGAVEGRLDAVGWGDGEGGADVGGGGWGGGGGEAEDWERAEGFGDGGEAEVIGAEVVAPFGDAVGFVDGEEGELGGGEPAAEGVAGEAFRGDVEEFEAA